MKALSDIEMVRACAVAMGGEVSDANDGLHIFLDDEWFDPLIHDAQAFALVDRLNLEIYRDYQGAGNCLVRVSGQPRTNTLSRNLRRAICECVANIARKRGEGEAK